jgi:hypothetical protein
MEMEKTLETAHGRFFLRPYRDEDEEQVIALWEAAFNQKMDRRIWRWKFHDNPFGRQIMLCLTENGMPIAMYAGIPYIANWNGQQIRMTQLIDNMSHPDFRQATNGRKGLFIQTAEFFFYFYGGQHASVFHYGFPGQKHFKLGHLFLNYSMIKDGGSYLEALPSDFKRKYLFSFDKLTSCDGFDDRFDRLWQEAKNDFIFSACRDRRFLQWRFASHPINSYETYFIENRKNGLDAYLVILFRDKVATIIDIFGKTNTVNINKLVFQVSKILKKKGVEKIRIWLPKNHFITQSLIDSGFKEKPEPLGIIPTGRSLYSKLNINFALENIFYTMADGDLF